MHPTRRVLIAALAVTLGGLAACAPGGGSGPATSPVPSTPDGVETPGEAPSPSASPAPACLTKAGSLTRAEQIGQLFMLGHDANAPVDDATRAVMRQTKVGSLLLLENTTAGTKGVKALTDDLRAASGGPDGVRLAVAADQEGGLVQRLQGPGFDDIPSATKQARYSDAELRRQGVTWGKQLRAAGVDVDLAPVADVVWGSDAARNEPIGALGRGFGSDPDTVAAKVSALVKGLDEAGVATSVKHFPGIGKVRGNTDFSSDVTDATTTAKDADLAGFDAGIEAGADMVMVSTVTYTKIDPDHQAVFSPRVMKLIADRDFDGVIVSDDLGAAKSVAQLSPGERATRFLEAGGTLVIDADPAILPAMTKAVAKKAAADPAFAEALTEKAGRVLAFKQRRGLTRCG